MDKKKDWRTSQAKSFLYNGLRDGSIPLTGDEMSAAVVYREFCQNKEEFEAFPYDKHFAARLGRLRKLVSTENSKLERDAKAFYHDREIYPAPTHDAFGTLFWPTSEARKMLSEDIDCGKHKAMKPKELWSSRAEYYNNFPLDIFTKHIHQEIKSRKYLAYLKDKASKKNAGG